MKFNLRAILGIVESIAVATVPGAAVVDVAVHGTVDAFHTNDASAKEEAILNDFLAGVDTLETFKPELIANDSEFKASAVDLHKAIDRMKASFKQ